MATTAEGALPVVDRARLGDGWMGRVVRFYLRWLTPIALALGVVLRTREWLHNKSLWLDEFSITQYITERGFSGLLKPLGNGQGAPVGWLWAERLAVDIFGVHDLALRVVPWLGSLIALGVFPVVARRLIGRVATPVAALLLASSPPLIYYAAETKQYSTDTACALLALLLTVRFMDRAPTLRDALLWGLGSGVLVWCSQPTILVAAACGLFLVVRWFNRRPALVAVLAGGVVLAAFVLAAWLVTLRQLGTVQILRLYWSQFGGYPPPGAGLGGDLTWLRSTSAHFTEGIAQFRWLWIVFLVGLWGLATLVRLRPWAALLLTLVLLAAIGAAVTGNYPLAHRLALYLLPVLLLLLTAGLADAAPLLGSVRLEAGAVMSPVRALRRPWGMVSSGIVLVALALVTASSVTAGLDKLGHPDDITSGRQAIDFIASHRQPGDVVLADAWALSAVNFYGPSRGVPANGMVSFEPDRGAACPVDPLAALRGAKRVWLLFAHHPSNQPADRIAVYASQFAVRGTQIASYRGAGDAAAVLFDLPERPSRPAPALGSWLPHTCFSVTMWSSPS